MLFDDELERLWLAVFEKFGEDGWTAAAERMRSHVLSMPPLEPDEEIVRNTTDGHRHFHYTGDEDEDGFGRFIEEDPSTS